MKTIEYAVVKQELVAKRNNEGVTAKLQIDIMKTFDTYEDAQLYIITRNDASPVCTYSIVCVDQENTMTFQIQTTDKVNHKRYSIDSLVTFLIINQEFLPNPIIVTTDTNIQLTIYHYVLVVSPKILANLITGMIERRQAKGKI